MPVPDPPTDTQATLRLYSVFHLNLAFSSIEEEARPTVIARCYRPLLAVAARIGGIGIEATGFTLEEIAKYDPDWIDTLRTLIAAGKAEFIGSGYAQMIGPLVPARMTQENLRLGNAVYHSHGLAPQIALVNEQAYSGGLVGLYRETGYRALLMDWNNPASFHRWTPETRFRPARARGTDGDSIGLIWTDTVAFQMLQRHIHGDIELDAYLDFVSSQIGSQRRLMCAYASDAEVFDYRPGRFRTEEAFDPAHGSEWARMEATLAALDRQRGIERTLLTPLLPETAAPGVKRLRLESPQCPIPVKKQRKYNLSRWAVTGRDDIALNAACERIFRGIVTRGGTDDDWRALCRLWASDNHTHITQARWNGVRNQAVELEGRFAAPRPPVLEPHGHPITERFIDIATPTLRARLDRRRGLALQDVCFAGSPPLIGKLPLGVYSDIALQADWYTGNAVFEAPGEHKVTDLEWAQTTLAQDGADIVVYGRIETPKGPIRKTLRFCAADAAIECDMTFDWPDWGKGSLRLGLITLLPGAWDRTRLHLITHNGGMTAERFALQGSDIDHGAPVSFLVSASHGFAMTEGWAKIADARHHVTITVDRCTAPLLGLLTRRTIRGQMFCQMQLSALELDDTRKPDPLYPGARRFRFRLHGGAA